MESAGRGLLSSNDELLILFDILLHLVNYYQGGIENGFMGSVVDSQLPSLISLYINIFV